MPQYIAVKGFTGVMVGHSCRQAINKKYKFSGLLN